MNGAMAIGAARDVGLRIVRSPHLGHGVAVDTGAWLGRDEQVVGARAVGDVAMTAILRDRCVVVDPGTGLGLMTLRASIRLGPEPGLLARVWRVTVAASEHPLSHGMMRGQVQLGGDLHMTADTEPAPGTRMGQDVSHHVRGDAQMKGLPIMGIVAVGAEESGAAMVRHLPVEQPPMTRLVAVEAFGVGGKTDARRNHHVLHVALTRSMAGLAIEVMPWGGLVAVASHAALASEQLLRSLHGRHALVGKGSIGSAALRAGEEERGETTEHDAPAEQRTGAPDRRGHSMPRVMHRTATAADLHGSIDSFSFSLVARRPARAAQRMSASSARKDAP